jgi:hypothetical protein
MDGSTSEERVRYVASYQTTPNDLKGLKLNFNKNIFCFDQSDTSHFPNSTESVLFIG